MKNIILFFININVLNIVSANIKNFALYVKVEVPKGSGNIVNKSLTEFIQDGFEKLEEPLVKENAIMVLGATGTGKSTLINYLNGIPLVCRQAEDGEWVVGLKYKNVSLPGGFSIGHGDKSETLYPAAYTPQGSNFTFIDNPGFSDTRKLGIAISSGFFRKKITDKVNNLKFLLLLHHNALYDRSSDQLLTTIQAFSNFIGIFDDNDTKLINKSIGIIITRGHIKGFSDTKLKEACTKKYREKLKELEENGKLTNRNELQTFNAIILNNQIEIFSNPEEDGDLNETQSNQIKKLIERLSYSKKSDLKFKVKIENSLFVSINQLLKELISNFESFFSETLRSLMNYYENEQKKVIRIKDSIKFINELNASISLASGEQIEFDLLLTPVVDVVNRAKLKNEKQLIEFFNELLPEILKSEFSIKNKLSTLINFLKELLSEQINFIKRKFNDFEKIVENTVEQKLFEYYKNATDNAEYIEEVKKIESSLTTFKVNSTRKCNFSTFISTIDKLLTNSEKLKLIEEFKQYESVNSQIGNKLILNKVWIGTNFISSLGHLLEESKMYEKWILNYEKEGHIYWYRGYFGNLSSFLFKINEDANVTDMKKVIIFTTHSFIFDIDYKIKKERYKTNSSDLIVISPLVVFQKTTTIDLSCDHIPDYPDNSLKASTFDGNGEDGKPGLPGFNGGNLFIFSNQIFQSNNLSFISEGGKGGPGQNGGDGAEGVKGEDALYSEIKIKQILDEIPSMGTIGGHKPSYRKSRPDPVGDTLLLNHTVLSLTKDIWYFIKYGKPGYKGGNAGRGGEGGYNGYEGSILLIDRSVIKQTKSWLNVTTGGQDGEPGVIGLGGNMGSSAIKGYYQTAASLNMKQGFNDKYSRMEKSSIRAQSGVLHSGLNSKSKISPSESKVDYYDIKNKYLEFLSEEDKLRFKNSKLTERNFVYFLNDAPSLVPKIWDLMNRANLFSSSNFRKVLPSFKNRLATHYIDFTKSNDILVLDYIIGIVSSLLLRYTSEHESLLVFDLIGFIEVTKNQITKWEELADQDIRDVYKRNYDNTLRLKIEEAVSFVASIQSDIEKSINLLNENMENILKELKQLQKDYHENDEILLSKKKELENHLFTKSILGSFKIASSFLYLLGIKGAFIAKIADTSIDIAETAMNRGENDKNFSLKSDENKIQFIENFINEANQQKLEKIAEKLKILMEMEDNQEKILPTEKLLVELELLENKIENLKNSSDKHALMNEFNEYLQGINKMNLNEEDIKRKLSRNKNFLKNHKNREERIEKYSEKIMNGINTAHLAGDVFKDLSSTSDEIKLIKEHIETNADQYRQLHEFEIHLNEFHNNNLMELLNNLKNIILDGKSLASLTFAKFQLKEKLDSFKNDLLRLVNVFDSKTEIINTISRIENSFTTLIEIFSRIENYIEQTESANFIYNLTKKVVNFGIPDKYQSHINSLKKTIHGDIIKERYEKAIEAFKYWSFPFFCEYAKTLEISEINSDLKITKLVDTLNGMLETIKKTQTELIPSFDNHIQSFSFENDHPFFKWSSNKYPFEIKQLLGGHKTTLYADVNNAQFDAIKFCTLYILIQIKSNSSMNEKLSKALEEYYVELTHSGISNYKFKQDKYVINLNHNSREKLVLRYRYGSTNLNDANESFKKLAINKPVLSPYTFWEIKLRPVIAKDKNHSLQEFSSLFLDKSEIIVSLNGRGNYVDSAFVNNSCRYKRDNPVLFKNSCSFHKNYEKLIKPD